mgnify:CR=1 FL=1
MKTLLLIDNQDITREGMKTVAGRIGGFAAIKEAGSQSELTGLLVDNPNAVAVLDYTLFDTSAEYLLILQERFKEAHFVLFSDNLSEDFIRRYGFSRNFIQRGDERCADDRDRGRAAEGKTAFTIHVYACSLAVAA